MVSQSSRDPKKRRILLSKSYTNVRNKCVFVYSTVDYFKCVSKADSIFSKVRSHVARSAKT